MNTYARSPSGPREIWGTDAGDARICTFVTNVSRGMSRTSAHQMIPVLILGHCMFETDPACIWTAEEMTEIIHNSLEVFLKIEDKLL